MIPYIEFKQIGNINSIDYRVFMDGKEVGIFHSSGIDNDFINKLSMLKGLVNNELVDTFKFMDKISKEI